MEKIVCKNEDETFDFAFRLGVSAVAGEVYALSGELGAGKTVFARGFARGLGIEKNITSPTFVLMNVYEVNTSPLPAGEVGVRFFCHVDAYRLEGVRELAGIGIEEYLGDKHSIVLIEWAERVRDILPANTKWLEIEAVSENERVICYKV